MEMIERDAFNLLFELDTSAIRLDCATLQLARDAYPGINMLTHLGRLDQFAEEVAGRRPGLSAMMRYQAMREILVEDYDFRGDEDDYYNPENGYVNRVLDRQRGMPITLSIIWLEVARRLKWPVSGIGFPGHFLIRFDDPGNYLIVDPFRAGRTLSGEDCQKILDHCFDRSVRFESRFLDPVGARAVLTRMLNNLRQIYLAHQNWNRLEQVLRRLSVVEPNQPRHVQELAALHYRRGDFRQAFTNLTRYLCRRPNAPDQHAIKQKLDHLQAAMAALN